MMAAMPRFKDEAAYIDFDVSAMPVLIASSFGVITEQLARESFHWLHQFATETHARGEHYVTIVDARGAGRPSAVVRGLISELLDKLRKAAPGVELQTLFVMENALIRGALTAIIWISRSAWKPMIVASWADAVTRAREIL